MATEDDSLSRVLALIYAEALRSPPSYLRGYVLALAGRNISEDQRAIACSTVPPVGPS